MKSELINGPCDGTEAEVSDNVAFVRVPETHHHIYMREAPGSPRFIYAGIEDKQPTNENHTH